VVTATISALVVLPTAQASDHGCTVLMCLSNPAGPTAVAECIAPIQKLWRDLSKGRAFPSCDEADGADGKKSFVRQVRTPYAACPSGLHALADGLSAVQATSVSPEVWTVSDSSTAYTGIGSGDALASFGDRALPPKVCVGHPVSVGRMGAKLIREMPYGTRTVWAFDRVEVLEPGRSGMAWDVYINGMFWQHTPG
jgi:hypothetical protein